MENNLKKLTEDLSQIKLTEQEKNDSWLLIAQLVNKEQPIHLTSNVAEEVREDMAMGRKWSLGHALQSFNGNLMAPFRANLSMPSLQLMSFILILSLMAGGATMASQSALPDSPLYAVKVGLEKVRSWTTISGEGQVQWETTLAARRLEEAEQLASENKLEGDIALKLENDFKAHAEKVDARIETLAKVDADEAADLASRFEASLKAHKHVLANLEKGKKETSNLLVKVDDQAKETSGRRTRAEAKVKAEVKAQAEANAKLKASTQKKMKVAKKMIDDARKEIRKSDESVKSEASVRLELAIKAFNDGKAKFDAAAYDEASVFFSESSRLAEEAEIIAEMRSKVRIEIATPTPSVNVEAEEESKIEVDRENDDKEDNSGKNKDEDRKENDKKEDPTLNLQLDVNSSTQINL